jgi:hypothetical protein
MKESADSLARIIRSTFEGHTFFTVFKGVGGELWMDFTFIDVQYAVFVQYIENVVNIRTTELDEPPVVGIDDVRNGLVLANHLHIAHSHGVLAFLRVRRIRYPDT